MTSGRFASFPLDQIIVHRADRQRRELTGIEELAASFMRVGQINPLTIQKDGTLRTGERRYTAAKSLGWTHVTVQFIEDLDEHELKSVELEENLRRSDLQWKDECHAVAEYHALRLAEDTEWTHDKTADALGMAPTAIGQRLAIAAELVSGNLRVIEAPKFSTARGIVERARERRKANIMQTLNKVEDDHQVFVTPSKRTVPLLNTSFHEWGPAYTGRPFNLIHCDFPYGINADKHDQGQAAEVGGYEDTLEIYRGLLATFNLCMSNIVAESAHLVFWFSMTHYEITKDALMEMGWAVNPRPMVWWKNDNIGILPDPSRGPRQVYETAFLASRGDRKIVRAVSDVCAWPGADKEIHMSEKPVPMLSHFMRMLVDEYSTVLDPTCGSGNALKAATALGAPTVLGLEVNEEFFNNATTAYFGEDE